MATVGPRQLLIYIWIVFSTVGSVISVASLLEDVIAWNAFIAGFITAYRAIVDTLWAPLVGLFPFPAPRWLHDYLTITSLMAVSVLWALHSTSRTFGWGGLGSVIGVIRHSLFDLRIGGNALELFETRTRHAALAAGVTMSPDEAGVIAQLTRPAGWIMPLLWGILGFLFLLASLILLPILIPAFLRWDDARSADATLRFLGKRKLELQRTALSPALMVIAVREIDSGLTDARNRASMYKTYHNEIAKQIAYYYLAVFVLFGLLVLANYFVQNFPQAGETTTPPKTTEP